MMTPNSGLKNWKGAAPFDEVSVQNRAFLPVSTRTSRNSALECDPNGRLEADGSQAQWSLGFSAWERG